MADNDFIIKVKADPNSIKQAVAQIKAEANKSVKELEVLGRIEVANDNNRTKERIANAKLLATEKARLEKQALEEKKIVGKQITEQEKKDAEQIKGVKQKLFNELAVQQRKSEEAALTITKERLARQRQAEKQANEQNLKDDKQRRDAQQRMYNNLFGGQQKKPLTGYQKLEVGENVATLAIGIGMALRVARQFTQELWNMAKAGAELQVLQRHFEKISGSVEQANIDMELLRTASSGNLNDRELITFTNRMREMGLTTQDSARILDFAERTTDVMGGTIEEAQAKLFKFIETGKGKGFEQMGVNIALVNQRVEELAKAQGKTTASMDVEELATLRLTTFMSMYGDSIEKINQKQPELDDKLVGSQKKFDNLKDSLGILLAEGLEPTITAVGKLASVFTGATTSMKPVDDMLKKITNGLIGTKDLMNALTNPFTTLYNLLTDKLPKAINVLTDSFSKITGALSMVAPSNFLSSAFTFISNLIDKVRELLGWMNKIPGVNISTTDNFARMGTSTWKDAEGGIIGKGDTGNKGSRTGKVKEETKAVEELSLGYDALAGKLTILYKEFANSPFSSFGENPISNKPGQESTKGKANSTLKEFSTQWNEVISSISDGISGLFESIASGGANALDGFKNFLKSIANAFITTVEAMLFAAQGGSFAKAILSLGASLITDMPWTVAGFVALEAARGIIGSFADGGLISGAGTGRSDSNLARVSNGEFIMNAESTRQNLPFLMAMNSGSVNNNVYIGSSIDGVKFFRSTFPQYENFRNKKRL